MRSFILLCVTLVGCCVAFRTQSVAVRGKLMCGDKPATGVTVLLIDQDPGPDPDDYLAQATLGGDGLFNLSGSSMELSSIDPQLKITHDCHDTKKNCQRQWIIRIPNKYITAGPDPEITMDLGIINLHVELENEDKKCDDDQ